MTKKRPAALKAGLKALETEVGTWAPKPKEWPAVGARVKLLRPHTWGGCTGTVVRHETIKIFPKDGPLPVVSLDDADGVPPGQQAFITQMDEWKPLR